MPHLLNLLYDSERSGSRNGVNSEKSLGNLPMGHVSREGDQQEDTAYEGRIEYVLSQASEGHLGYTYGNQGSDEHNPPGSGRRKVEGQEYTGYNSRPVPYRGSLFKARTAVVVLECRCGLGDTKILSIRYSVLALAASAAALAAAARAFIIPMIWPLAWLITSRSGIPAGQE